MARSKIEWTQETWNPTTGCTKVSAGCSHCYAETMTKRLVGMGQPKYRSGFKVAVHQPELDRPRRWRKPRTVFVNSMGDLFHRDVPTEFIAQVFDVMAQAPKHVFQVLTKRTERLVELSPILPCPANVWMGVTVESEKYVHRIDSLRATDASVRFLSLEPLLGPIQGLDLTGIDWVIVGGETGPKARPMRPGWVTSIRDQCQAADVPFFFKHWGGKNKKKTGRILDGRTWDEMP